MDALFPPHCLVCGDMVGEHGALCHACWGRIDFVGPPLCAACGLPFEYDSGPGTLCGACARRSPPFQRARAVMIYNSDSRRLILDFKHGDRTDAAPAYGRWLLRAGGELIDDADLVAPVPLHWTRLFARRYNQAALLGHAVGRAGGVEVIPDLLIRRRRTPPQGRLSPSARRRNLRGAFQVRPLSGPALNGRRVLLIDNVVNN